MRCEDLKAGLDEAFNGTMGKPQRLSQTGEEYIEFVVGSPQRRPVEYVRPVLCLTEEQALVVLDEAIRSYARKTLAREKRARLYWRTLPETDSTQLYLEDGAILGCDGPHYTPIKIWKAYARLLLSDKPAIKEAP